MQYHHKPWDCIFKKKVFNIPWAVMKLWRLSILVGRDSFLIDHVTVTCYFFLIAVILTDTNGVLIASSNASLQVLLSSGAAGLLFFVTDYARKDLLWKQKCALYDKIFICFLFELGFFFPLIRPCVKCGNYLFCNLEKLSRAVMLQINFL